MNPGQCSVPTYRSQAFLMNDGRVYTGGTPSNGCLGMGDHPFTHARPLPVSFSEPTVGPIKEIHHAKYSTHVLTTSGALWSWGYNAHGQVGDGTTTQRNWPRQVIWPTEPPPVITQIVPGAGGSTDPYTAWYALDADGHVWSWGYNGYGQLALGDKSSTYYAPQKTSLTGVVYIAAGGGNYGSVYAITGTGEAYAAGYSGYGQTGLGTGDKLMWAQVDLPGPCVDVSTTGHGSYGHTLWLLDDGRVFVAGYSAYGQSGVGTSNITSSPVHISTIADVVNIWAGGGQLASTYAACENGDFYCWGYNGNGQLGLGNTTHRNTPARHSLNNIVVVRRGISSPYSHTILLDNQGYAYAAGYNGTGQCGLGHHATSQTTHELMHLPQGVQGTIVEIQTIGHASEGGTALLDSAGRVWVCGYGGGRMLCVTPSSASTIDLPVPVMF